MSSPADRLRTCSYHGNLFTVVARTVLGTNNQLGYLLFLYQAYLHTWESVRLPPLLRSSLLERAQLHAVGLHVLGHRL